MYSGTHHPNPYIQNSPAYVSPSDVQVDKSTREWLVERNHSTPVSLLPGLLYTVENRTSKGPIYLVCQIILTWLYLLDPIAHHLLIHLVAFLPSVQFGRHLFTYQLHLCLTRHDRGSSNLKLGLNLLKPPSQP